MAVYKCEVCDYEYDEEKEGVRWDDLPDNWVCPVCESPKSYCHEVDGEQSATGDTTGAAGPSAAASAFVRSSDELEVHMADIHQMAASGESTTEPMRTKRPVISWDDLLIKGAQLARMPLNQEDPVNTQTVIGPSAKQPLVIETPLYISHMSFGALSREAKIALATGSAAVKTAMCSGEGGILPESRRASYKYIFEYVPNLYSVTDDVLKQVDAIEIKIGQSAKPGMGGHLPGGKVTAEVAKIRGREVGEDITSPSHFEDIRTGEQLCRKVEWLRKQSEGRPIGIKLAAGEIEADLEVALKAKPDFITIDGRPGSTGAASKYVKAATSIPTIFALYRARRYLDVQGATDVSLVITGGLRVSCDFAKALALGADAIALATAALMACGCQQYRVCHTGKCPTGIATQDPELRARLHIERSALGLENYLRVATDDLRDFARLTGRDSVHDLCMSDLCTTNSEVSHHTDIEHV